MFLLDIGIKQDHTRAQVGIAWAEVISVMVLCSMWDYIFTIIQREEKD